MKEQRQILVLGGAGFIGLKFVELSLKRFGNSVNITVVDALGYASDSESLQNTPVDLIIGRIEEDALEIAWEKIKARNTKFDLIVNFAAETHVDRSILQPRKFIDSNVVGVQNVLDFVKKYQIQEFLQISTDEVYGDVTSGESTENSLLTPSSPYAASKASADLLTLAHHRTYGTNVKITRCVNNYGAGQNTEKFIPRIILQALHGLPLTIYGSGTQTREWIHVSDHIDGIWSVISSGQTGQIYNIGSGERFSNLEVAKMILELSKSKSPINHVKDRPGHDFRYAVNSKKIRDDLGWKAKLSFRNELKEMIEFYKEKLRHSDTKLISDFSASEKFYRGDS